MPALVGNTWAAMAVALGAFLLLFGGLQVYARATGARPETTRKLFHTGSGLLTLAFPFLFRRRWPVLLLTGASALLVAAVKFLPALRDRFGRRREPRRTDDAGRAVLSDLGRRCCSG